MAEHADTETFERRIKTFCESWDAVVAQIRRVIVGHDDVVEQVLTCLLCGGHGLIEGVPGLGKTLLVRTLADALELSFSRIQFTPDLMPADITGTNIVVDGDGARRFDFQPGPIFANIVLADEINRATPKTQSAVLEAMQERTVTVARTTHELPAPFLVLATQNPLEMEGTYPLPEAQVDRFLLKILIRPSSAEQLVEIMDRTTGADMPTASAAIDGARLEQMRQCVRAVHAAGHVKEYIARLVGATHPTDAAPERVRQYVRYGASPRAAQALLLAGKVRALRCGRAHVAFEDIAPFAAPALRHRLILSFEGQADGIDPDEVVSAVLAAVGSGLEA
ncbi:MAG: AAA family ATPase [Phycisphaerae bacterium]|nr:AAA family ATPase [Phycisphaerae bacterium]